MGVPLSSEEWRDIPGYEGYYQVSDLGRVRSVDRVLRKMRPGGGEMVYPHRGRVLRSGACGGGYLKVTLSVEGVQRNAMIHTLVAITFIGPRPDGHVILHANGDRLDNRLANLSWGTPAQNGADMVRHGTNYWRNKKVCLRGHPLADPNLVEYQKRRPGRAGRQCKACYCAVAWRARRRAKGESISDEQLQQYADVSYARILKRANIEKTHLHEGASRVG